MQFIDKVKSAIRNVDGYPRAGIIFKDITPVLADPLLTRGIIELLVMKYSDEKIDAIAAVEARGFILGSILAHELNCSFIPVRKAGRLPFKTKRQQYDLEYGQSAIEVHIDAVKQGGRVLIHDDLLATGGTASAAGNLIKGLGGELAGFSFLINLSFLPGEKKVLDEFGLAPHFLIKY